ncbi:hypothetical protein V1478_018787 [Vespula squamosa]|uniref:Uncharacterized protein n=1 Tax=Vespula squamosa TaxID=30214 RepID=A0ABD1ZTT4_VESSQ
MIARKCARVCRSEIGWQRVSAIKRTSRKHDRPMDFGGATGFDNMYLADCIVKNLGRSLEYCNVTVQSTKTSRGKSLKVKVKAEGEEKVRKGERVTAPSVSGAKIRNEERVGVERGCGGGGEGGRVPWLSELARISESFDEEDRLPEEVRRLLASSGELRVELIADANEKAERAAEERIFQRRPAAPAEMRRLCLSINMRHETRRNRFAFETRDNKEKGWLGGKRRKRKKREEVEGRSENGEMVEEQNEIACTQWRWTTICINRKPIQAVRADFETTFGNNTAAAYISWLTARVGVLEFSIRTVLTTFYNGKTLNQSKETRVRRQVSPFFFTVQSS